MANVTRISPEEAKKLMETEGYIYLDVRSEPEYAAGHPKGAHNIPLLHSGPSGMTPNPDFVSVASAAYAKDQKIIVGCKAGGRSLKAADALTAAGFTNIIDQRAGFDGPRDPFGKLTEPGWSPLGLPTETETPGVSYAELKNKISGR
jgi:rhodanese-related sulfurtransferase